MALVTLTSDFGTADGYVGAMKGVILGLAPSAVVLDITHSIERHDIAAGAFALAQSAPHFPPGTIHVAVIDPGVGGLRAGVVAVAGQQVFIGPDNGIFSLVAPNPDATYEIRAPGFVCDRPSSTFHGRDVFATCAGQLAAGASPRDAGPEVELCGVLTLPIAAIRPQGPCATVLHIDAFGNLITDLGADEIAMEARFEVAGHVIKGLSSTFESVAVGELVAYVGSGNTLEIAVREGSAAQLLGVSPGTFIEILSGGDEPASEDL